MKILYVILLLILLIVIYNYAFEVLTNRQIVFAFIGLVAVVTLYFSLRLCFVDKDNK